MKYFDFLQLFEDGGGEGAKGGTGGAGTGSGTQGNSGNNSGGASYSFEQAEEIANARADRASRAALANYFKQQGISQGVNGTSVIGTSTAPVGTVCCVTLTQKSGPALLHWQLRPPRMTTLVMTRISAIPTGKH